MKSQVKDFLAITGPTTSGKTQLSIAVAEALDSEIICMDSRQIYRGMDIGTDKVSREHRERVPHHGLDLRDPDEFYSAGQFGRDAHLVIEQISGRGHVPMLVGGTGLFLRSLTHPIFKQPDIDASRLEAVRGFLATLPMTELARWVTALDPGRSDLAREGGPQRVGRTIEVALLTGRPLSWWHRQGTPDQEPLEGLIVVLDKDREELDRRIDARVTRMAAGGLVDEVKGLLEKGYGPEDPGMSGTGYREVSAYLGGEMTLDEALDRMRSQTRQYARRQLTWFRNQLPEDAIHIDTSQPLASQVTEVCEAWRD
ncbi:MAG TPA: tRNA (adenosine(37)-N6)-dimethylallyltransferase MiaA [Gemmatimonadetes bacterium]|nr:tRNA (adenosine(37)-N6)-dimethylallyltransferase MiaA [Gemmatimonadota bacterium]